MVAYKFAAVLFAVSSVAAQANWTCTTPAAADLVTLQNMPADGFIPLVDPALDARELGNDGLPRHVDNAQGTYGSVDCNLTFTGADMKFIPISKDGYWFFKMEAKECWDGTGYNAFEFDISGPVGGDIDMTLTLHQADCLEKFCPLVTNTPNNCTRSPDSAYLSLAKYVTVSPTMQKVTVPIKDFLVDALGTGIIDMRYVKDFTFIQFNDVALNKEWSFNNFIVKAGCIPASDFPKLNAVGVVEATTAVGGANGANGPTVTKGVAPTATTGSKPSGAGATKISSLVVLLCIAASIFVLQI